MDRSNLMKRVKELVSDVTRARFEGRAYAKVARAHGYADGYMRALLDAQVVDRTTLLHVITETRQRTIETELEPAAEIAKVVA